VLRRLRVGPHPILGHGHAMTRHLVLDRTTVSMTTSDRTRLDASVWRPDAPGRFPVLLMRPPYGRAIASTLVYAHPAWYAAQGYVVVVQDVRDAGTSEGTFRLFETEEADGAETVAWALDLPGCLGRLGMYGFSYQAMTQLLALAGGAGGRVLAPAMTGWTIRTDWAWEGGAFAFAAGLGWAARSRPATACACRSPGPPSRRFRSIRAPAPRRCWPPPPRSVS
jgi:putative CocE/NonD family hydrolase